MQREQAETVPSNKSVLVSSEVLECTLKHHWPPRGTDLNAVFQRLHGPARWQDSGEALCNVSGDDRLSGWWMGLRHGRSGSRAADSKRIRPLAGSWWSVPEVLAFSDR